MLISDTPLPKKIKSLLSIVGFKTVEELLPIDTTDLYYIHGFGHKQRKELDAYLSTYKES